MNRTITPEVESLIVEMAAAGISFAEIAAQVGASLRAVSVIARAGGVSRAGGKPVVPGAFSRFAKI